MSGKRDRPAHFDIDQKTLEYKNNSQQNNESHIDNEQKIKQRKIYKIKMPGNSDREVSQSKPKFTLFGSSTKEEPKPQLQQQKEQQKPQDIPQAKAPSQEKVNEGDIKEQPKEEKKNFLSNFSFSSNRTNPFGNGIGIFTSGSSNGEGIFSGKNIFANKDSNPLGFGKIDLGAAKASNTIFGTSQSVFNFSSGVPPIKKQASKPNDDEDDGDSAELQKDQKLAADPTKSTGTYQYNNECHIVFQKKLIKFKKNEGDSLQNTEVVIQNDAQKSKDWVIIRLSATKNPILTGLLVKGKSQVKKLGNKDENVILSVMTIKDNHPQKNILKMQFQNAEDGKAFREVIAKMIN